MDDEEFEDDGEEFEDDFDDDDFYDDDEEDDELARERLEEEEDWIWLSAFVAALEDEKEARNRITDNTLIVRFEGVNDEKTCPLCSFLHGKYFFYKNIKELGLIPPLHEGCRDHLKFFRLNDLSSDDKIYRIINLSPSLSKYHTFKNY